MRTQIKSYGGSLVIVLPKDFIKYHKFKVNDWIDIDDNIKVNGRKESGK